MTFKNYLTQAKSTCMQSSANVAYMMLNLVGEVGETAEKMADNMTNKSWAKHMRNLCYYLSAFGHIAKQVRKDPDSISSTDVVEAFACLTNMTDDKREELSKELGDIMWQLFCLIDVLGYDPEDVAQQNLDKLASRKQRDQIDGDGDNR